MQNSLTAVPRFRARLFNRLGVIALMAIAPGFVAGTAEAKTPGSTYCFYKTCHRVKTLAETRALVGKEHTLPASFYDDCKADRYNPCGLTSSGEKFKPNAPDNAASSIYPDGTKLLVWSADTLQALVLRINNAGPYWGNRTLDVSRAAAEKLGFKHRGTANLKARILEAPSKADATYKKNRTYAPVAGDIGRYESAGAAHAAMTSVQMIASATLAPFNGSKLPASLVTDLLPASSIVVADLAAAPKLPAEALADASALATLRWPVVRGPVAAPEPDTVQTAALEVTKRAGTLSQRVTKARLSADDDGDAKPAPTKAKRMIKDADQSSERRPASRADRTAVMPVAKRSAPAALRSDAVRTAVRAQVKAVPVTRDAPNDMSVFSRHNPDAPTFKAKQAANKTDPLKTGLLKTGPLKTGPLKTTALATAKARRES